jgi:hypothetical protein
MLAAQYRIEDKLQEAQSKECLEYDSNKYGSLSPMKAGKQTRGTNLNLIRQNRLMKAPR